MKKINFAELLILIKKIIKSILYYTGFFNLVHRLRNKNTLTVTMFHRILPKEKAGEFGADPLWTITPGELRECLYFFHKHYNIISLKQLLNYMDGKSLLPKRALLLTFDDGWRDNHTYALPLLKSLGCPAALFMVGDSIGRQEPFWQEQVFAAWKKGLLKDDSIDNWLASLKKVPDGRELSAERRLRYLIRCLSGFEPEYIIPQLERYANSFKWRERAMLSKQELMELCRNRITIGAHGLHHRMLTKVNAKQLVDELKQVRNELEIVTGQQPGGINSLSFPHGSYSAQVVGHARDAGYKLLFSSDAVINVLKEKDRAKRIWGRIVIDSHNISKPNGTVCKVKLSRHVMFHSKNIISVDETLS